MRPSVGPRPLSGTQLSFYQREDAMLIVGAAATLGLIRSRAVFGITFALVHPGSAICPSSRSPTHIGSHAGQLGLDCRYCHVNVERAPLAMWPPTETCMNCHQLVRTESKMLQPIRDSWRPANDGHGSGSTSCPTTCTSTIAFTSPPAWAASSATGGIDSDGASAHGEPLSMGWCLECHRDVKREAGRSSACAPSLR